MSKTKRIWTTLLSAFLVLAMVFHMVTCSTPEPEKEENPPVVTPPGGDTPASPNPEIPTIDVISVVVNLAQKQPVVGKPAEVGRVIDADKLEGYNTTFKATAEEGISSYKSNDISVVYDTNADEYGVYDTVTVDDCILLEQGYYDLDGSGDLSLGELYAEFYEVEVDYNAKGQVEGLYYYDRYYIYHYDSNGRLSDIYLNGEKYKVFAYNANGNIVSEESFTADNPFSKTYAYTEDGKLYSVNGARVDVPHVGTSGVSVGNDLFSWSEHTVTLSYGGKTATFEYGYAFNGERFLTKKAVDGVVTTYKYVGDKAVEINSNGKVLSYILDKDLNYVGLSYGGVKYYFAVDPFGNVMGLVNADGEFAVEYRYDIWGTIVGVSGQLADTLGALNEIVNLNGLYDLALNCYFFADGIYLASDGITLSENSASYAQCMYLWEQSNYFARSSVSTFARIHDMVVDVAVKNLREQGVDVVSNLYANDANGDSRRLVDIYTLDYSLSPFSTKNLLHGNQIYEVIYHAPESQKFQEIAKSKIQDITEHWKVSYYSEYSPSSGRMTFHGQFIFLEYLIDYRCAGSGIVEYQVKKNVKQNYDQTLNIYDYDNNKYVCYVNNTFDLNFLDGVTVIPGITKEQYDAIDGYLSDYLQSVAGNVCDQMLIYDDPNYYDLENMNVTPDYWAQMNLEDTVTYLEIQADGSVSVEKMPSWETDSFKTRIAIGLGVVIVTAIVATIAIAIPGANCIVVSICVGAAKGAAIGAVSGFAMGFVQEGLDITIEGVTTGNWDYSGFLDGALDKAASGFSSGAIVGAIMGGISGALKPTVCFEAGTPIATANGAVAIENIAVGDMVWSYDYKTGEKSLKPVTATTVRETNQVLSIEIGGEQIVTTPEHPFYIVNNDKYNGYVAAKYLSVGDCILTADGGCLPITSIKQETLDDQITVYNFTVDDNHSYYVGENQILAHNVNCASGRKVAGNEYYRQDHCSRHATGVGADPSNPLDYWQKADDFITNSISNSSNVSSISSYDDFLNVVNNAQNQGKNIRFIGADGRNYFYDPIQKHFAVASGDNSVIFTYYSIANRPNPLQYLWRKF